MIFWLEASDVRADALNAADYLVTRDHWVGVSVPVISDMMDIRMANPAAEKVDEDVVRARTATLKAIR